MRMNQAAITPQPDFGMMELYFHRIQEKFLVCQSLLRRAPSMIPSTECSECESMIL